jgi:hypothetical protein
MPEVDHFLGSSDMLKLGDVLRARPSACSSGNPADWVVRASDPRVLSHAARQRLREDRRGLQPHLLLLRDPGAPRQAALAPVDRRRARGARLVAKQGRSR